VGLVDITTVAETTDVTVVLTITPSIHCVTGRNYRASLEWSWPHKCRGPKKQKQKWTNL